MKEEAMADNDVTVLFEKHTVVQVQDMLRRTRSSIEKKKEDLRMMVGERYRDLIEAADTISDMKDSAGLVCENIKAMEGLCGSLHQRGLIGFKTQSATQPNNKWSKQRSFYSVAAQVKLLVDIPEVLWSLTERCQFLPAAQLLLLARHTHTVLQLSLQSSKVLLWFPVIERQWASIAQFQSSITRGCYALISSENEDIQRVCEAVVALMLVEGEGVEAALKRCLQLRGAGIEAALASQPTLTAKSQISSFLSLLISSLSIVYRLFTDKEGCGELEMCVKKVTGIPAGGVEGALSLLQLTSQLSLAHLPETLTQYKPSVSGGGKSLSESLLQQQVQAWLNSLLKKVKVDISSLLAYTTSVKALTLIRTSVREICDLELEKHNWKEVTACLLGPLDGDEEYGGLHPWNGIVRERVVDRCRDVIRSQLTSATKQTIQMAKQLAQDIETDPSVRKQEADISSFVWSESAGDLPERVGWTSLASRTVAESGGLYHKTRGYTGRVQAICRALQSSLQALLEDISQFGPGGTDRNSPSLIVHLENDSSAEDQQDYLALLEFLQQRSLESFSLLVSDLGSVCNGQSSSTGEEGSGEVVCVAVSRLMAALPSLCPTIRICSAATTALASPDQARRISLGVNIETPAWSELKQQLTASSCSLLTQHLSAAAKATTFTLKDKLHILLQQAPLKVFPNWESESIEEEGEGGEVVGSSIRVAAHPSPALLAALHRLCTMANLLAAHTIARSVQLKFSETVNSGVLLAYESCISSSSGPLQQTLALQLLFDLKFLQTLLIPRDEKELHTRVNRLIEELEGCVDPFDLDVFRPHLNSRVKTAAHRDQALLGVLVTRERQVLGSTSSSSSSSGNTSSVILLPTADIPRFSNVPLPLAAPQPTAAVAAAAVAATARYNHLSSTDGNTAGFSPKKEVAGRPRETSSARTAASLLTAMSSSWFGSS